MTIRVVIADDHTVVRTGIRELLTDEPDIDVVGEARNGYEVIDIASVLHPDVLVMDIAMPELNGVEATRQIRAAMPRIRIMVLTAYDDDPYRYGLLACYYDAKPLRRGAKLTTPRRCRSPPIRATLARAGWFRRSRS